MTSFDGFITAASEEVLQNVARKIQERNIEAVIVETGEDARKLVAERIPNGAEVHSSKSKTLHDAGIFELIQESGNYDSLRPKYMKSVNTFCPGRMPRFVK